MKYGYITKTMLDYVEVEMGNNNTAYGYPSYTDLNNYYKQISGSNSFSHHLPNLRNENTERKCGRYIEKVKAFPTEQVGKYMLKHREVNPYIAKLKKLVHVLTCAANEVTYPSVTNNIQFKLDSVYLTLQHCKTNSDYKPDKLCLLNFNDYYRSHLPSRLK
jgi:hypothetical protein